MNKVTNRSQIAINIGEETIQAGETKNIRVDLEDRHTAQLLHVGAIEIDGVKNPAAKSVADAEAIATGAKEAPSSRKASE